MRFPLAALVVGAAFLALAAPASASIMFDGAFGSFSPLGLDGTFNTPNRADTDSSGNVYVTDSGNSRVQKFNSTGTFQSKFGSVGTGNGQFQALSALGIAIDSAGDAYVLDKLSNRVQEFNSSGVFVRTWGSLGTGTGQFSAPSGVALDSSGNVYVADTGNNRIQKFTSTGTFITQWGSAGTGDGQFTTPSGVAVDSTGNVYVADTGNTRVQKFTSSGIFITNWGSAGTGDGQFGVATTPSLDLAVGPSDNVVVVDPANNRVEKFRPTGTFITKWGTTGTGNGQFTSPSGVAVSSSGEVYVVDQGNNRVQRFSETDTTAPDTTLVSGPAGTSGGSVSFTFSSPDSPLLGFECKLDSVEWQSCSSPKAYSSLSDGSHTFQVRAVDPAGNPDPTPASRTWTVDATPPDTTINSGPSGPTNNATPTFTFSSSEPGSSFQCRFDSDPFAACSGSGTHTPSSPLSDGSHTFEVRAIDPAGNVDPSPASQSFSVDATPPDTTITGGPTGTVNDATPQFTFTSTESGTFQCRFDSNPFAACTSPHTPSSALSDGSHTFEVRAIDAVGNVDPTPASRSFTVDTTPPDTTITGGPNGTTTDSTPTFTFSSSEPGSSFQCRFDSDPFAACSGPGAAHTPSSPLTNGSHSFDVKATDGAGNTDPTPASRSFTVDTSQIQFDGQWGSFSPVPTDGTFNGPSRAATDSSGDVYVTDTGNTRVQKFTSTGGFLTKWGSLGAGNGQFLAGGALGIATDPSGNVYVVDKVANRVQKFNSTGGSITQWGGVGTGDGQFTTPSGVATDSSGNVYVADTGNNRIQEFDSSGTFIREWGGVGTGDGQFTTPSGVAVDSTGDVYVADSGNSRIEKFDSTGNFITKWGIAGTGDGQFGSTTTPTLDLAIGFSDNVVVVDPTNNRVEKFRPIGTFITKWGSAGTAAGQFALPSGVAVASSGEVYIVDQGNNRVQRFHETDTTAPDTTLVSGPSGQSNDPTPSFTFSTAESQLLGFECRIDSAEWQSCNSPKTYLGLSQGAHTFQVRAVDAAGNPDPTPATRTWTIDTVAPNTIIDLGPSGPTNDPSPTFSFHSPAPDTATATFECRLDSGAWLSCSSPKSYGSLADGPHTFDVRATDPAGNVDPSPASQSFSVDATPPDTTITGGPTGTTNDPTPTFTFTSTESGTFQCAVDSGPYAGCASPKTTAPLADGPHTFNVRARDSVGNLDPTPASRSFTVDATPTETIIDSGPNGPTNDPTPTFTFHATEAGSTFKCKVYSGFFSKCNSPMTTFHLPDGTHTFQVQATDPAGNTDTTPATRSFSVQTAAVHLSGSTLVVTAAAGSKDNFAITKPSASVLRVTDSPAGPYTGSGVHAWQGCKRSGDYTANCNAAGITLIKVTSGVEADKIVNSTAIPSTLDGGPADDVLTGGSSDDTLIGGPGADVMKGMNGNDQLLARDSTSDTTLDCDGGASPGSADIADLDPLPQDSPVINCETVIR